jgi:hypothetical protein
MIHLLPVNTGGSQRTNLGPDEGYEQSEFGKQVK